MAELVAHPGRSVVAYGPVHVVWNLLYGLASDRGLDLGTFIPTLVIPFFVALGLWARVKAFWVVGILLDGVAILLGIGHIVQDQLTLGAIQVGGGLVMLGLLLAPPTRRWVA